MVRHVVVGDLRVQRIERKDGRRSWTIVWPEGTLHAEADRFLREHEGLGTQKTYAYYLVDALSTGRDICHRTACTDPQGTLRARAIRRCSLS